ncbi:HHE domain protein [Xylaria flabelliformis]|nr:HHE domain protein [Xylaria flabelliformis]
MFRSHRLVSLSVAARALQAPLPIIRRQYAEAHFPGPKVDSLQHSQIWKISEAIREDHKQLKDYYNRVVNSKDLDEQERYGNAFIWELARHSIAEEIVVYPAFERDIHDDGKGIADKDRAQHQGIKEQLYEFQKLKPKDEAYLPTLERLFEDLQHHIKEEEENDLVKLERQISLTESKELSQSFERTKMLTPTRSHPSAPNKPPFETVIGLMIAPIDKIRDLLFTKFPEKKMPDLGHTKHGVGKSDR